MKLTLEHLKAHPEKRDRFAGVRVRIWSGEHRLWWGKEGRGYTSDLLHAGTYTMDEAWENTHHCHSGKRIEYHVAREVRPKASIVTIEDAARRYVAAYRAVIIARKAWHDYLNEKWGAPGSFGPTDGARRHAFGHCRVPLDQYGTEAPLCDICAGSEPLYAAYRAAICKRQGALRSLLRRVPA